MCGSCGAEVAWRTFSFHQRFSLLSGFARVACRVWMVRRGEKRAFLFLDVTYQNVGQTDPNSSVRKSANLRINSGHVRLVKFEHSKGEPRLAVKVQSSMSRRKSYRVTVSLATGEMCDSCINRELRLVEDQCSHLRLVPELLYRISHGFERIQFVNKAPSLFPDDAVEFTERFHDIATLGEDLAYQRLLTRACVTVAKKMGIYEQTKHFYIAKEVGVRVHHVADFPICVRPRAVTAEYRKVLRNSHNVVVGAPKKKEKKKHMPQLRKRWSLPRDCLDRMDVISVSMTLCGRWTYLSRLTLLSGSGPLGDAPGVEVVLHGGNGRGADHGADQRVEISTTAACARTRRVAADTVDIKVTSHSLSF